MKTLSKKNRRRAMLPVHKVVFMLLVAMLLLVTFVLNSCKPKEIIISHTEYVERVRYDSIYLQKYDSVRIIEKGDTVLIEKYKTVFKDRLKIQKDTILRTDTVVFKTVPEEIEVIREVPVHGFLWWTGLVVNIAGGIFMVYKIYKTLTN